MGRRFCAAIFSTLLLVGCGDTVRDDAEMGLAPQYVFSCVGTPKLQLVTPKGGGAKQMLSTGTARCTNTTPGNVVIFANMSIDKRTSIIPYRYHTVAKQNWVYKDTHGSPDGTVSWSSGELRKSIGCTSGSYRAVVNIQRSPTYFAEMTSQPHFHGPWTYISCN